MKKILLFFFILSLAVPASAAETNLTQQLSGRILLQVESYGRAWYIDPVSNQRYYLQNGPAAYEIMKSLGLGITDADLAQIPTRRGQTANRSLVNRLRGRILLQVQQHGEAWYVNPVDGLRYYLRDGEAAYTIMRTFALGISNNDLATIPVTDSQIVASYTFNNVAYAVRRGGVAAESSFGDEIVPLASLTKLMTALVLLDLDLDWNKTVTITAAQLNYPQEYVGNDPTSEVDLQLGDRIAVNDLWIAMLNSSSNQAAVALVDQTGLTRAEFIQKMNQKAQALGLTRTIFFDVAGLDAHNVTTAKEMAIIAETAFQQPEISGNSVLTDYSASVLSATSSPRLIKMTNRNFSLLVFSPTAAKTGFLVEAQRTVAVKKGETIVVVMHARSMTERNNLVERFLQ